jgi:hypothetical protein
LGNQRLAKAQSGPVLLLKRSVNLRSGSQTGPDEVLAQWYTKCEVIRLVLGGVRVSHFDHRSH